MTGMVFSMPTTRSRSRNRSRHPLVGSLQLSGRHPVNFRRCGSVTHLVRQAQRRTFHRCRSSGRYRPPPGVAGASGIVPVTAVIVPVTDVIGVPMSPFVGVAMPRLIWPSLSFLRPMPSPMRHALRRWKGRHDWHERRLTLSQLNVSWNASNLEGPMPTEALICVAIEAAQR